MTTHFKTRTIEQAIAERVPGADEYSGGWDNDWLSCVVEYENNTPVRIVGDDAGEPEDMNLRRNWSWVAGELNQSYHKGYTDAEKKAGFREGQLD